MVYRCLSCMVKITNTLMETMTDLEQWFVYIAKLLPSRLRVSLIDCTLYNYNLGKTYFFQLKKTFLSTTKIIMLFCVSNFLLNIILQFFTAMKRLVRVTNKANLRARFDDVVQPKFLLFLPLFLFQDIKRKHLHYILSNDCCL